MIEAYWATHERYGENQKVYKKSFKSIDLVQRFHKSFIEEKELGGSNISAMSLYENDEFKGFLSYNGRFWDPSETENTSVFKKEDYYENSKMNIIETHVAENIIRRALLNKDNKHENGDVNWNFIESDLFIEMKMLFNKDFISDEICDILDMYISENFSENDENEQINRIGSP